MQTIQELHGRVKELKEDNKSAGGFTPEDAVFYWLCDLRSFIIDLDKTSLGESDKRERMMAMAKKLIK